MQTPFAVLTAVLLLFIFPQRRVYAQAEAVPFELREVLTIGADESAPPEYLFTNPEHIRTDREGRIYVAERQTGRQTSGTKVRAFSAEGEFLGAMGRRGEGPGEFMDIQSIALDAEDRLVVFDATLQRFTRFPPFEEIDALPRPDREALEIITSPEEYPIGPAFMHGLPDGRFVLFYQPRQAEPSPDQPRLHIYDERLEKVGAFGTPSEWRLSDTRFGQHLVDTPQLFEGSHVAPGTARLLLAPTLYQGTLYQYVLKGTEAPALQRLDGQPPGHPTHDRVVSPDRSFSLFTSAGMGARYRSTSHGVGQLSDGRIVHLSTAEDEDGVRQLQLEVFGPDGELQRVGPIEGFTHDKTAFEAVEQAVDVSLRWVDRRDHLYLVDFRSGFPVLRVVELVE